MTPVTNDSLQIAADSLLVAISCMNEERLPAAINLGRRKL